MEEDCLKLIEVPQDDSPSPKKKAGIKMRLPGNFIFLFFPVANVLEIIVKGYIGLFSEKAKKTNAGSGAVKWN